MEKIICIKMYNRPDYIQELVDALKKLNGIDDYFIGGGCGP